MPPQAAVPEARTEITLLLEVLQRLSIVETQNGQILAEQQRAGETRRDVYAKLEALHVQVSLLQAAVDRHNPIVSELQAAANQGRGMALLSRILWTVGLGVISGAAAAIGVVWRTRGL